MNWIHPGFIYIAGAIFLPFLPEKLRKPWILLIPFLALGDLILMGQGVILSQGETWTLRFLDQVLVLGRIDRLSLVFGYIFVIASLLMGIYALHTREKGQHVAAMIYVGSTLGVVFAGDLLSLFFFWEAMAWSSVFLIWYRKTKQAYASGLRYLLVHFFGGLCLLAGILLYVHETGSTAFDAIPFSIGGDGVQIASVLILIAFLINAAVPPLHAWLSDAYPEATITGAVFLTAFTTKSAVYALIRGFPGTDVLIWLGAIMAVYGVVFAVLENDIRRLLAYHIISQVGYMICGVGMGKPGTEIGAIAINGAVAHAFCHILYKALLFMGAGTVLLTTGKNKLTELGGLYKYMPLTFHLYMVGAYSISGFPLFNGFVSKTMVVEASAASHLPIIWLMLEGASIGTFLHTGLKLPWGTWFARKEAACSVSKPPKNMLVAMGLVALSCVTIGMYPKILYDLLPYPVRFEPYTATHVVDMCQLLLFTFAGFWLLKSRLHGERTITVDFDWFYRVAGNRVVWFCRSPLMAFARIVDQCVMNVVGFLVFFGTHPAEALFVKREQVKLLGIRFFKLGDGIERHVPLMVLDQENPGIEKELPRVTLGASIVMILLLFSIYLAIYLAISD